MVNDDLHTRSNHRHRNRSVRGRAVYHAVVCESKGAGMTSDLETLLAFQMKAIGIPFTPQFQAIPGRQFRFDFKVGRILVEVNGGIWQKGGHSTGRGISRDYEKNNLATMEGYKVLTFTADTIHSGEAVNMIEQAWKQGRAE